MAGHLICIGGLPGAGKTTVAEYLRNQLSGSVALDPDKIHLKILGKDPEKDRLVDLDITKEAIAATIEDMKMQALEHLRQGKVVIIGSAFILSDMRAEYELLARDLKVKFSPVWLEVNAAMRIERAQQRQLEQDSASAVSDDWVRKVSVQGDVTWPKVDASSDAESVFKKVYTLVQIEE